MSHCGKTCTTLHLPSSRDGMYDHLVDSPRDCIFIVASVRTVLYSRRTKSNCARRLHERESRLLLYQECFSTQDRCSLPFVFFRNVITAANKIPPMLFVIARFRVMVLFDMFLKPVMVFLLDIIIGREGEFDEFCSTRGTTALAKLHQSWSRPS